ncbi:MAG: hypothetical protein ACM3O3_05250 [Syntrophothermus sp.]
MSITAAGLTALRKYVQDNWKYVSILDGASAELLRLEIGVDARCTVYDDYTVNPLILQIVLSGDDLDITLGDIVSGVSLYDVAVAGSALLTETLSSNFTFEYTEDELTIKVTIEIPDIT